MEKSLHNYRDLQRASERLRQEKWEFHRQEDERHSANKQVPDKV